MAGGTFAAIWARTELPLVRVFVAIHALCERYRRLEIAVGVATGAIHSGVLTEQRKSCF